MTRFTGVVLSFLVAFTLWGCKEPQKVGGEIRAKNYRSAVSLSPSTTELMLSLAYEIPLVGRTSACNYPSGLDKIEVVADVKPNYEAIKKLKPGLIVYDPSLYSQADIQKIKQLGIDTFEFNAHSLSEYEKSIQDLSVLTGSESTASENLDRIYRVVKDNDANAPEPRPKVMVLMGDGKSEYMAAGVRSFQGDVVNHSGGSVVGPNSDKFETVNIESVIADAPDIILSPGNSLYILRDPRLANVPAVKNRKVVDIESDVLLRAGSRVEDLLKQLGQYFRTSTK